MGIINDFTLFLTSVGQRFPLGAQDDEVMRNESLGILRSTQNTKNQSQREFCCSGTGRTGIFLVREHVISVIDTLHYYYIIHIQVSHC